jgi:hypothetical protein
MAGFFIFIYFLFLTTVPRHDGTGEPNGCLRRLILHPLSLFVE